MARLIQTASKMLNKNEQNLGEEREDELFQYLYVTIMI